MLKHIVMWRLKAEAMGQSRAENAHAMRDQLLALRGLVPGLLALEVGLELDHPSPQQAHVLLYSVFDSAESLAAYAQHPQHLAVVAFIQAVSEERRCLDYCVAAPTPQP